VRLFRPGPSTRAALVQPVGGSGPLGAVAHYEISSPVLARTLELIRAAAADFDELFVAWAGQTNAGVARITELFVPRQRCIHTTAGMLVHIDGDALFELNKLLYDRGLLLIGQAHAHPTNAFHSGADDELAFATAPGALSLVIPDWARDDRPTRHWRWHRRTGDERWERISGNAVTLT
jgi:hypothetical protein